MEKNKKTIIVTGAKGLLGSDLVRCLKKRFKVIPLTRENCDITDEKRVFDVFRHYNPWLIIHTAGYTDVDGCQKHPQEAFRVNALGTAVLAKAAKFTGAFLIYISTDYVFSGKKTIPYRENDRALPLSVYGKSKLEGERYVKRLLKKYIIIRTSWLFGRGKVNFVDNVLSWAKSQKRLRIVADKYASPTYSIDLSKAILKLIGLINGNKGGNRFSGIYHITNSGYCSWLAYAQCILKTAKLNKVVIEPVAMSEMNFLAQRPVFSVLDNSKFIRVSKYSLRPWQKAVKEYMQCAYRRN